MIVTIFRSRLKPENAPEYAEWAGRIAQLARTMPGYVSHKAFTNEDGERVTIVEFADEASQEAWRRHARHLDAQKKGRRDFYLEYKVQVCTVLRESKFVAEAAVSKAPAGLRGSFPS